VTLQGTINHVALAVSDLDSAMTFFTPLLNLLGYEVGTVSSYQDHRLVVSVHRSNGIAINVWEAEQAHPFHVYEPGLHHLAFNVDSTARVDELAALVVELGGEILDGPGEFPFAESGYYAVYFLGPDRMKIEAVFMPELAAQV